MKHSKYLLLFTLLFSQAFVYTNAQTKVKVACIGNSITYGTGLDTKDLEIMYKSYPFKLQGLLNTEYPEKVFEVKNYAVPGTTMLKDPNDGIDGAKDEKQWSYWESDAGPGTGGKEKYDLALKSVPDIVVIKFGTNDARDENWRIGEGYGKEFFYKHYVEFINSFRAVNPNVTIYICYTLPSEKKDEQARVIRDEVIPTIKQIARENKVYLIDLHSEFYEGLKKELISSDKIHPTVDGATLIANEVFKAIKMNVR